MTWIGSSLHIALKDLHLQIREWRTLTVLLLIPMLLILILGTSIEGVIADRDDIHLQLVIVDESQSPLSSELISELQTDDLIDVRLEPSVESGKSFLYTQRWLALIRIGPEFEDRYAEVELLDVLDSDRGRLTEGLDSFDLEVQVRSIFPMAEYTVSQIVLKRVMAMLIPDLLDRLKLIKLYLEAVREERGEVLPVSPEAPPELTSSPRAAVYRTLVPAYAVFFAFFLLNMMALSFIRERKYGTLNRLRLAPIRPTSILFGKVFAFFLISLSQGILLFASARTFLGVSWGPNLWALLLVIVATALAATSLGLCLATAFRSETQVHSWASLLVITMAAVSGCMVPRDWMSSSLQNISFFITPHSWALRAYDQILYSEQIDIGLIATSCLAITSFSAAFFIIGYWRFKRLTTQY